MDETDFLDEVPASDSITAYDERHLVTYLHLLDADKERADWREVAKILLGIDPVTCPDRARRRHESHLERARWMMREGHVQLAARGHEKPKLR